VQAYMGPLVELVCELTEYEPDLEMWSYRKKGYKSYNIQGENSLGLFRIYHTEDFELI